MKLTLTTLNLARLLTFAKRSVAVAVILPLIQPSAALAATKATGERWFEIEVILFNQLDDKSTAKEQFPDFEDLTPLPRYKKVRDILTPYLYPDISALKQQLPQCGADSYPASFAQQASRLDDIHPIKTLAQIEQVRSAYDDEFSQVEGTETAFTETYSFSQKNALDIAENEGDLSAKNNATITDSQGNQLFEETFVPTITAEQLALVNEAEQAFSPFQFIDHKGITFLNNEKSLCKTTTVESSLTNGFPVDKVEKTIDGIEDLFSKKPYLISKESLQLHDIVTTLKRSKNFQPLLHIGWREAPLGRKKAIPIRVFAGDNLQLHHEKQLAAYQQALANELEQEKALSTIFDPLVNDKLAENPLTENQVFDNNEQQLQNRLTHIFSQIDAIPEDAATIIATLDSPDLALTKNNENLSPMMMNEPPVAPVQPWSVDGFFKVNLNHYLYITADFNIMNMSLAEKASQALRLSSISEHNSEQALINEADEKVYKPIRFEQNRRVISGEIHYFDHPYIGMIVQIRKHKRPELPELTEGDE